MTDIFSASADKMGVMLCFFIRLLSLGIGADIFTVSVC
jgi:hypothetical protein